MIHQSDASQAPYLNDDRTWKDTAHPTGVAVSVVNENLSVYLELRGTLSPGAELEKIRKKVDEIQK